MSKSLTGLLAAVLLVVCTSCVTEVDVADCENTFLRFEYMADGESDVFPDYISSVTCCFYGEDGELVKQETVDKQALDMFQGLKVRLPRKGNYSLVAWGNVGDNCRLATESLAEAKVWIADETLQTLGPLYLGNLDFSLDSTDGAHEWTVRFHSAHITLNAYIRSTLPDGASAYSIRIGKFPAAVAADGDTPGPDKTYIPVFKKNEGDLLESKTQLPRFAEDTDAVIEVFSTITGQKVASVSLAEYMAANGLRVSGIEEAEIDVLIAVTGTNISIRFPGWKPRPVYPKI